MDGPISYPLVQFLVRYGRPMAVVVAIVVFFAVALWAATSGQWWLIAVGAVLSALLWALLRSYVEVVQIVADTLLPR
ncbi:MAG: hypothetical protein K0U93_23625 [Gammaproteobacteria bacterium]|nr:hypothetical protein [Gammaproteobacteria bacterium]